MSAEAAGPGRRIGPVYRVELHDPCVHSGHIEPDEPALRDIFADHRSGM